MRTMQARYPGICARTGRPIVPGDIIGFQRIGRRSRTVLVSAAEPAEPVDPVNPDLALVSSVDPELAAADPAAATAAGAYLRCSMARGVSDVWRSAYSGREYYRNRRGRCEDAPCCGCCNI